MSWIFLFQEGKRRTSLMSTGELNIKPNVQCVAVNADHMDARGSDQIGICRI